MNTLFKDIRVLTMDEERGIMENGCVMVSGDKIAYVGERLPEGLLTQRIVNGRGMILMPGLVNAHTHLPMNALRGYADDLSLQEWLFGKIMPVEEKLDGESVRICAEMAMAEAISTGTTAVSDMYFFCDGIARAAASSGIRANLSRSVVGGGEGYSPADDPRWLENVEVFEKWHGHDGGRIKIDASVHAEYTSSPEVWEALAREAKARGMGMHIHLSETRREHEDCVKKYGRTPAELFYNAGLLGERTYAAHCVYVSDEDIALLAETGTSVSHCPVSNLKLASGVAPAAKMLAKGVNVALGTDGAASNNSLDMFEEMKLAAILQKGVTGDAAAVPAMQALKMATVNGARSQGREGETGLIKEGAQADLVLLDTGRPGLTPCHEPDSSAVYSAKGSDVAMTMVGGRVLWEKGEFKTLDWEKLKFEFFTKVAKKLFA